MPVKRLNVAHIGPVSFYKRSGTRSLRLTIGPSGEVRVSLPKWAPYAMAVDFVRSRQAWILEHKPETGLYIRDHDHIGKSHRVSFVPSANYRASSRVTANEIQIRYPSDWEWQDQQVQTVAHAACVRALKRQAEQLLPIRVQQLAAKYRFQYRSIEVKRLKARWGSCNHRQDLVFNLFLMQLPWDLIDYVILHELQHTTILKHGPVFWEAMARHTPAVSLLRKKIRAEQPILRPTPLLLD